jgi:hypothetical protein
MGAIQESQFAGERKVYTYDWEEELDGDTIASDAWSVVPTTLTVTGLSPVGYVTSCRMGVITQDCTITNTVTCTSGQIRVVRFRVNYKG